MVSNFSMGLRMFSTHYLEASVKQKRKNQFLKNMLLKSYSDTRGILFSWWQNYPERMKVFFTLSGLLTLKT